MFEKNNPTIALHLLYTKEIEICPTYVSNTTQPMKNK